MKSTIRNIAIGVALASTSFASAQQINPMTEAVIRNYTDLLKTDPKDYITLYDRATMYFNIGEFERALSDIDMALEYTPDKESEYRAAEYSMKCDILAAVKDYKGAIEALNSVLAINPGSQQDLYKGGNLYLLNNQPEEALKMFQRLQRENTRSQEAYYGMAKAYVQLGRREEAIDLVKQIESYGKQSFLTYCRIGDLYTDMDRLSDATTNYVIAYNLANESQRPIESLKFISRKNPDIVLSTLDNIIQSNPDNQSFNYIKAILAFDSGKYNIAENACKELAKGLEKDSPAVYRMMALTQLAQNKREEAKQSIQTAEGLAPGNINILLDKAEIYIHDEPLEAWQFARAALKSNPDNEDALLISAKAGILAGKDQEALADLNNIILSDPSNLEALLLRGYLNSEILKDGKAGVADYTRASNIPIADNAGNLALAALGKEKIGKKLDSEGMINDAIKEAGTDSNALYLIAVYFAQTGNLERAKEFADKAVANGFTDQYKLRTSKEPLINLSPIHHLLK